MTCCSPLYSRPSALQYQWGGIVNSSPVVVVVVVTSVCVRAADPFPCRAREHNWKLNLKKKKDRKKGIDCRNSTASSYSIIQSSDCQETTNLSRNKKREKVIQGQTAATAVGKKKPKSYESIWSTSVDQIPHPIDLFCVAINIINILKDEAQLIERRRKMDEQQQKTANRADNESIDNL